jgi:hypothetical protein
MKTLKQISKQSDLIHAANILGARYESNSDHEHLLHLPCGIPIRVQWAADEGPVFFCENYHRVDHTFTSSRDLSRRIQSYVWVICEKWDQQNHPENK